jgi:OmpA-OmpF porin, OOP family
MHPLKTIYPIYTPKQRAVLGIMESTMWRKLASLLLTLSLSLGSLQLIAADQGEFYFAPGLQWMEFDNDFDFDDDWGYTVGLGYQFTHRLAGEISSFDLDAEDSLGSKFDIDNWKVDLLYDVYEKSSRIQPFVIAGVGNTNFSGENDMVFDVGAGIKVDVIDNLEWRTAIRKFEYLGRSSGELDWGIDSTLVFYFGGQDSSRPSVPIATTPRQPSDQPQAPVEDPDSDLDGVPDSRDNCPDTPRTYAVDNNGCPIAVEEVARVELLVNFDFDRSEVKPQYFSEIQEVADFIEDYPDLVVELEGHTDATGTNEYNQGLSERRANAVRDVLIDRFDVQASRVSAAGFGETQPVATNETSAGRAENRRVITVIIRTVQNYRPR